MPRRPEPGDYWGDPPADQVAAFDDRETRPPRARAPVRWVCGKCGDERVRPDQATSFDDRYTTGRC